jgi:prepilin-type N-terminal cleavage/methylation domain-containing protein
MPDAREAGFTLIEMLVTLAVIAILAVIALPSFFGESRKSKAFAEVQPMFNDLRVRLEQYLQERGTYPLLSPGEATLHPASAPSATPVDVAPLPAEWLDLKVRISGNDKVSCRYTWATGPASSGTIGPVAGGSSTVVPPVGFGFVAPATEWYYLLAVCDMDGAPGFSYYFTSSVDPTIRKLNEGD